MAKGLSERERLFVAEYLRNGGNGTKAAIAAGVPPKGAHVTASRLLKSAKVRAALEAKVEKVAERAELTVEWVLAGIKRIGDDSDASRLEQLKAYELGGKFHKLFTDKLEHTGKDGGPIAVAVRIEGISK